MTVASAFMLGLMLLLDPADPVDAVLADAVSKDADRAELSRGAEPPRETGVRIRSVSSDFDRGEGVAMFEGDVVVEYADEYVMCADRLWLFFVGTNELSRVVADGHVSITNDTRVGTCSVAKYRRRAREIEMFGDDAGAVARLADTGESADMIEGSRIKFWLDSEQVEVNEARIRVENGGKVTGR